MPVLANMPDGVLLLTRLSYGTSSAEDRCRTVSLLSEKGFWIMRGTARAPKDEFEEFPPARLPGNEPQELIVPIVFKTDQL